MKGTGSIRRVRACGEGCGLQPVHNCHQIVRVLQAAEKLDAEADSVSPEGGGGFNPRIKPAK